MPITLTPQQEEQIKGMIKDGKANKEITEFFKTNYQLEIPYWKVAYIREKLCPKQKAAKLPEKKAKGKRGTPAPSAEPTPKGDGSVEEIKKLIDQLFGELKAFSAFTIRRVRIELVKAIAEARENRRAVGEKVESFPV